jgi:hypothetical protein
MVLGEPVLDSKGRLLARKGEHLTGELLALLRASGIANVFLAEAGVPDIPPLAGASDGQLNADLAAAIRKRLDIRFRKHQDNPNMRTIRHLAERQLILAKLSKQNEEAVPAA